MSNASALIVKFIVERARRRDEADADDLEIDSVGSEDVETAEIPNEAEAAQTVDRGVGVGAAIYDSRDGRDGSAHAHREKRRRLSKRVVESVVVEPAIAKSGVSRGRNRPVEQNSSKTPAQAADQAVSEVVRVWERECTACRVQGCRGQ